MGQATPTRTWLVLSAFLFLLRVAFWVSFVQMRSIIVAALPLVCRVACFFPDSVRVLGFGMRGYSAALFHNVVCVGSFPHSLLVDLCCRV